MNLPSDYLSFWENLERLYQSRDDVSPVAGPVGAVPSRWIGTCQVPGVEATLADVERFHIARVLDRCSGVITTAAKSLGIAPDTLLTRMRRLKLDVRDEWKTRRMQQRMAEHPSI